MSPHILISKVILRVTQMLVAFYGISCITNVSRMIIYLAALAVRNSKGVENRNDTHASCGKETDQSRWGKTPITSAFRIMSHTNQQHIIWKAQAL